MVLFKNCSYVNQVNQTKVNISYLCPSNNFGSQNVVNYNNNHQSSFGDQLTILGFFSRLYTFSLKTTCTFETYNYWWNYLNSRKKNVLINTSI